MAERNGTYGVNDGSYWVHESGVIKDEDLRIEVLRYSLGPEWAASVHDKRLVRVTHIPTGLVAESDSERSQIENKAKCLEQLHAALLAAPDPWLPAGRTATAETE